MVRAGGSTDGLCHLCFLVCTPLKLMSVMSVCCGCYSRGKSSCEHWAVLSVVAQWFHPQHYVIIWGHLTFCQGRFGDVKMKKYQVCDIVCGCGLSIKVFWELVYGHIVAELSELHFNFIKSFLLKTASKQTAASLSGAGNFTETS